MSEFAVLAASFMDADGYGNDRTGRRPWPDPPAAALRRGEFEALPWGALFISATTRFGRMDGLSRIGLMAVELLDAGLGGLTPAVRERMGVCVETHSGSLATDASFLRMSLASTFAYTLPSTLLGEVCIRHRFRGPVLCLLPGAEEPGATLAAARGWLERGEAAACVCVGADLWDKEIAGHLPLPEDARAGDWRGYAVLVGRRAGPGDDLPWPTGALACVTRSVCLGGPRAGGLCAADGAPRESVLCNR